jgi:hypothetical protein
MFSFSGKNGYWRKDACSQKRISGLNPESAANGPHLSGARGVGRFHDSPFLFIDDQ